jgi:hypothetical protein
MKYSSVRYVVIKAEQAFTPNKQESNLQAYSESSYFTKCSRSSFRRPTYFEIASNRYLVENCPYFPKEKQLEGLN